MQTATQSVQQIKLAVIDAEYEWLQDELEKVWDDPAEVAEVRQAMIDNRVHKAKVTQS